MTDPTFKWCAGCSTRLALNATKCIVCGSQKFVSVEQAQRDADMLLEMIRAAQRRWTIWEAIRSWFNW